MSPTPREPADLELVRTTLERQAVDSRLSELRQQLSQIQRAIAQSEWRRESLVRRELQLEGSKQPPAACAEPVEFDIAGASLEVPAAGASVEAAAAADRVRLSTNSSSTSSLAESLGSFSPFVEEGDRRPPPARPFAGREDWEDGLDGMGIAKCHRCGQRLPLDVSLIEEHSKECVCAASEPQPQPVASAPPSRPVRKSKRAEFIRRFGDLASRVDACLSPRHSGPSLGTSATPLVRSPVPAIKRGSGTLVSQLRSPRYLTSSR